MIWPKGKEGRYLYSKVHIVQLTKTQFLAHLFVLIVIAYSDEIALPRTFCNKHFLPKISVRCRLINSALTDRVKLTDMVN